MSDEADAVGVGAAELDSRYLRSALEFAVLMAEEGLKRRPPLPIPKDLKPFCGGKRLPSNSLGRVRRIMEDDPDFRALIAKGALPEVVDDIGRLWLARPTGWEHEISLLVDDAEAQAREAASEAEVKRAEKRREAAERATARTRVELVQLSEGVSRLEADLHELRTDVTKLEEERDQLRLELTDARNELRHARDREAAARARAEAADRDRDSAAASAQRAEIVRDEALAGRADALATTADVESALHMAHTLANQLESLLPAADDTHVRPEARVPLALPGGLLSGSAEAAEFLIRSDAAVFIDGYNVTKLQWSERSLQVQREMLLDAVENLARRYATDMTVVFDGTSIVGAHTTRRRLVRVVYSPEGIIADDVIRDEVRRLPTSRAVVVVTDDREIVRDVRAEGANTVPSNAFLAIL